MQTLLFISAGVSVVALVGAAMVRSAFKNAATGYEDENGFHPGVQPVPLSSPIFDQPSMLALENRIVTFNPSKNRAGRRSAAPAEITIARRA